MTLSGTALAVFVKYPEPGRVKTRIAATAGAQAAADAYERMLRHVLAVVAEAVAAPPEDRFTPMLYCDPFRPAADYERYFAGGPGTLARQAGADLGERMAAAFAALLARHERALLIGTDCVELTAAHLQAADAALRSRSDLVLGPALDGGYYLIGMKTLHRPLFEGIAWSTGTVLAETLARADAAGLRTAQLEPLRDIDEWEDWLSSPLAAR